VRAVCGCVCSRVPVWAGTCVSLCVGSGGIVGIAAGRAALTSRRYFARFRWGAAPDYACAGAEKWAEFSTRFSGAFLGRTLRDA
jgi:hypothetical protein